MSEDIAQLSIKALLGGEDDYVIPMYQRNYAWDEGEITQLIQDIIDYLPEDRNYYIGTLVVYERKGSESRLFETIDGQQRLTTLSLLASYLKHTNLENTKKVDMSWYQKLRIKFEIRENSSKTLAAIFNGNFNVDYSEVLGENEVNTAILNGYRLIGKILLPKLRENERTVEDFTNYLFDKVQIMRVKVPDDTDLNHYFEIMNSRGEQLEKHEVLKAKMMEVLERIDDPEDRQQSQNCLHAVWEACSNMERYVQMGFPPDQRSAIFGEEDRDGFDVTDFDALVKRLQNSGSQTAGRPISSTLEELIGAAHGGVEKLGEMGDEAPERFNSVINFPNFLLQVLRVITEQDLPLDDKRLIPTFEVHVLKNQYPIQEVKCFTFSLLRCKYLFDQYVLKREFIKEPDAWSLKRLKWNDGGDKSRAGKASYINSFGEDEGSGGENRRILMLLAAFHVSTPTMAYKHWLNAALHYLFHAEEIEQNTYLGQLESVAKAFVFDRFLVSGVGRDYFEMIYQNKGKCQARREDFSEEVLASLLSFGQIENNLVFNFLDYLLWLEHRTTEPVKSYKFSFRSSVEHYYPQHPYGHPKGMPHPLPPNVLDSFGNLCLISHSKNSRLSNYLPSAKKDHYRKDTLDSVKQYLMMQSETWDEKAILEHEKAMKDALLKSLKADAETT